MRKHLLSWEEIVDLARHVDARAAARSGIDTDAALRLSHAILAFHEVIDRAKEPRAPEEAT
jgi:hypothetical protein